MKRIKEDILNERLCEFIGAMKYLLTIPEGDSIFAFRRIKQVTQQYLDDREAIRNAD